MWIGWNRHVKCQEPPFGSLMLATMSARLPPKNPSTSCINGLILAQPDIQFLAVSSRIWLQGYFMNLIYYLLFENRLYPIVAVPDMDPIFFIVARG